MKPWNPIQQVRQIGVGMLDLLFPRRCVACGDAQATLTGHVCWECLRTVQFVEDPMCSLCGDPVDGVVGHEFCCHWCRTAQPAFDCARSAVRYRGAIRRLIQQFKYANATYLASDLSLYLTGLVRASGFEVDAICYVPLHPRKARERGFNQSRLLAECVARSLSLPLERNALKRVRFTETQTHLNSEQRKENVHGAFVSPIADWVEGRHWLLIDDVMTTGATVAECAAVLKRCGASSVNVGTIARS